MIAESYVSFDTAKLLKEVDILIAELKKDNIKF